MKDAGKRGDGPLRLPFPRLRSPLWREKLAQRRLLPFFVLIITSWTIVTNLALIVPVIRSAAGATSGPTTGSGPRIRLRIGFPGQPLPEVIPR